MRLVKRGSLMCALALVILLTGCSSGSNDSSSTSYDSTPQEYYDEPEGGYIADTPTEPHSEDDQETGGGEIPSQRKVIQNASLEIESDDAGAMYANILEKVSALGGYEFSSMTSNRESYSIIEAVVKVPPQKLRDLMDFIGDMGTIQNSSLYSDDVTDSYYDAQTRLETKRKSLERYYDLLSEAADINEIVYIQGIIDGITEDIEAYEGRLRLWDVQTSMATVEIHISQYNDPITERKEISWNTLTADDMGYLIKSGFVSVMNVFTSLGQWIIIALLALSPILIIGVIILVIFLKKKKRTNELSANENSDASDDSESSEDSENSKGSED